MCLRLLLLPVALFFAISISNAQGVYDTTYYRGINDSTSHPDDKIVEKEFSHYYRVPGIKTDEAHHVVRYFLTDGTPISLATFKGIKETAPPLMQFSRASREGLQRTYYPSGNICEEWFLSNGVKVGKCKVYHPNGKPDRIGEYLDNERYLDLVYFDSLGFKISEGRWLRVSKEPESYVRNGLWKFYHEQTDRLSFATTYRKDIENGLHINYDSASQRVAEQGMQKDGLAEGEWQFFHLDTAVLLCRITYKNDKRHGPYYAYYVSGQRMEVGQCREGLREGIFRSYYPNGNRKNEIDYKSDIGRAVFYDKTGKIPTGEGSFKDYAEHGPFILYYLGTKKPMAKYEVVDELLEGSFREYHSDGHLIAERTYSNNRLNGPFWFYHEFSDKVWIAGNYENDTLHQDFRVYYRSGAVKRHAVFERGTKVSETCYSLSNEPEDCDGLISEAVYKEDLLTYIGNNLVYPEEAKKMKIEGKALVRFEVNAEGLVKNVRLLQGFDTQCDQEALRLIGSMERWVPARIDDKNVSSYKTVPVVFWLP